MILIHLVNINPKFPPFLGKEDIIKTITIVINKLNEFKAQDKLTSSFFKVQYEKILKEVDLIKIHDSEILNVLEDEKVEEVDFDFFTKEVESQVEYHFSLELSLDDFREFIEASSADKPNLNNDSLNSTNQFLQTLNNLHINEPKPPPLECDYFEGSSKDKFEFHTFLTQFNTIIDSKAYSNSVKLSYLHTYLKGYARK